MWLLIASDLMFFVGLIGAIIVLRAGNNLLFANHVKQLSKETSGAGALLLAISSGTMFIAVRAARQKSVFRCSIALLATLLFASAFMGSRLLEFATTLNHHTILARERAGDPLVVFDGQIDWWNADPKPTRIIDGFAAPVPADFDVHAISEEDVARLARQSTGNPKEFTLPAEIFQDVRYGPAKNIFYASWYTLTAAHLVHVAVGAIAILLLLIQNLLKKLVLNQVECVALFWHFIVMLGIVLIPLLYLR